MANPNRKAPSAAETALGANVGGVDATGERTDYHSSSAPRKRIIVKAIGPNGQPFTVVGMNAKTLLVLVKSGEKGVTTLDVARWARRFSAYCHELRHRYGLSIYLIWENHDGGKHGRYVLRSTVTILKIITD